MPNAELLLPVMLARSALEPNAVLLAPVVLEQSTFIPTAELSLPVVLEQSDLTPNAILFAPTVLSKSALVPTATLFAPVVLLHNALVPILVFVATLPPPSPIFTPFTIMSCVVAHEPVISQLPDMIAEPVYGKTATYEAEVANEADTAFST